MHELGIVFYIINNVKKVAEENGVSHVSKVVMNIGEVSTVVPYLLSDCWDWAVKKEELLTDCKLEIHTMPAVSFCKHCGNEFETVKYGKTCPFCKGPDTYLLKGNEVEIKEMEV